MPNKPGPEQASQEELGAEKEPTSAEKSAELRRTLETDYSGLSEWSLDRGGRAATVLEQISQETGPEDIIAAREAKMKALPEHQTAMQEIMRKGPYKDLDVEDKVKLRELSEKGEWAIHGGTTTLEENQRTLGADASRIQNLAAEYGRLRDVLTGDLTIEQVQGLEKDRKIGMSEFEKLRDLAGKKDDLSEEDVEALGSAVSKAIDQFEAAQPEVDKIMAGKLLPEADRAQQISEDNARREEFATIKEDWQKWRNESYESYLAAGEGLAA